MRVLFICKNRLSYSDEDYSNWGGGDKPSGLLLSAKLISHLLHRMGHQARVVDVIDNNDIDREVSLYQPTHVIIEALWVVPEKFYILKKLHPRVKWIVRIHSEVPFLANEGIAMKWLFGYKDLVGIGVNSTRIQEALSVIGTDSVLLRNFYPVSLTRNPSALLRAKVAEFSGIFWRVPPRTWGINIGCFGAIRPLKNHLIQALAAVKYADEHRLFLSFHINYDRVENRGTEVLRNLRGLFDGLKRHRLVEHPWMEHDKFVALIRSMDIGMTVSFSETFSIVAADTVCNNVPIVVSPEVIWASRLSKANPNDMDDIVNKIEMAYKSDALVYANKRLLKLNGELSKRDWGRLLD